MALLYVLVIIGFAALGAAVAATASLRTVRDPRLTRWLTAALGLVLVAGIIGQEVSPVARQLRAITLVYLLFGLVFLVALFQATDDAEAP